MVTGGIVFVGGVLLSGGWAWLFAHVFDAPQLTVLGVVGVFWIGMQSAQILLGDQFRGFHDIRMATVWGGLVTALLPVSVFFWFWLSGGVIDLKQAVLWSAGAGFVNCVLGGLLLWNRVCRLNGAGEMSAAEVVVLAWPMGLTSLGAYALTQADLWIVGMVLPQEMVAVYGVAARTVLLVAMPLMIVNAVVPPLIAEMYARGRRFELERTLRKTATVAGIPALVVLLGMVLFGSEILDVIFGAYYSRGVEVLAILSVGQAFNVWAGSCGVALMMTGNQMTLLVITLIGGGVTVGVALLLITPFGVVGVATAAATAMVVQNVAMLVAAKRATGMWTHMRLCPG